MPIAPHVCEIRPLPPEEHLPPEEMGPVAWRAVSFGPTALASGLIWAPLTITRILTVARPKRGNSAFGMSSTEDLTKSILRTALKLIGLFSWLNNAVI